MSRGNGVVIEAPDLREFRRDLKRAGDQFPKQLQQTNKHVVEKVVLPEAKRRGSQSRRNLAGGRATIGSKGVATIRALATQRSAAVAMGGARTPWVAGNEWGSGGKYRQFPRKNREGHILWPVVEELRDEIVEEYRDAVGDLAKIAFPK